jgi:DNA-directed RNA polymerase specialized sigma24 family protein
MPLLHNKYTNNKSRSINFNNTGKQLFQILNKEILKLPDSLRKVFVLKEYHNMQYYEISEITNDPLSRVKKNMEKAIQYLNDKLHTDNIFH